MHGFFFLFFVSFSADTYVKVQESSRKLWNHQNYELLLEYRQKPLLPGPFIIANLVFLALGWCFMCIRNLVRGRRSEPTDTNQLLATFQMQNTEKFIVKTRRERMETDSYMLSQNVDQLQQVLGMLHELQVGASRRRRERGGGGGAKKTKTKGCLGE